MSQQDLRCLFAYKLGLIVAALGSIWEVFSSALALGQLRQIPVHAFPLPLGVQGTLHTIYLRLILSILLNLVVLALSGKAYGRWMRIDDKEEASRVLSLLVVGAMLSLLAMNMMSLIGLLVGMAALLYRQPEAEPFRYARERKSEMRPISPERAYDELLSFYQGAYGIMWGRKKLEEELEKTQKEGLTRDEAILKLYERILTR